MPSSFLLELYITKILLDFQICRSKKDDLTRKFSIKNNEKEILEDMSSTHT